jgi:uroporphyrinogen III methyltransferase/synthase
MIYKLKILSRNSPLAEKQIDEVVSFFPDLTYEVIAIKSYGDKHKEISLLTNDEPDFFTRELDRALLSKDGDIAIHSAKDLPFPMPSGLEVIALLKAKNKTDALVSKRGLSLKDLPSGSKIGTSSQRRMEQILQLRNDLEIVEIRGTIEERLNLIDQGSIFALIVATCALQRLGLERKISEILPIETHPLQGNLAIVAQTHRADLKVFFSKIDIRKTFGKVFLVGAGPGEPELLTIKADKALRNADLILFDYLIDQKLIENYRVTSIYVGKRKGNHSFSQEEINNKLYQAALSGNRVARLKGGDPFIFGRGGEEMRFLQERLIDVEVIPGISAMQGAAVSSQIPLTMRRISNHIHVMTSHSVHEPDCNNGTDVYYMGATRLNEIQKELLKKRRDPNTPVALVQNAGMTNEKIVITSVSELADIRLDSPLTLIAGDTVSIHHQRSKILFTGLDPWHCKLPGKIVHYPLIEIKPMKFKITEIEKFDAIVFTSKIAVRAFCEQYSLHQIPKILAIGQHTRAEIELYGYHVDIIPAVANSDNLANIILDSKLKNVLYPCSQLSANQLHKLPNVTTKIVYETKKRVQPKIDLMGYAAIVFSSGSTVIAFHKLYERVPIHMVIYVYGYHTSSKLKGMGYESQIQTLPISPN